jgi:flagellar hook-associated protein 3 FlgL
MRVTFDSMPNTLVQRLGVLSDRLSRLQIQVATGQRIQVASDDPSAMRRVLDMEGEAKTLTQYQDNIARLQNQATASYSVMSGLQRISNRIGEIVTLADDMKSPQELQIYAGEVSQLIQQAVQIANTKGENGYLFSGTATDTAPFALSLDANGNVTGVTYQGNTNTAPVEIADGNQLSAAPVGANISGSGPFGLVTDTRTGADFFAHMISLQNHLLAGDTAAIRSTDQPALAADEQHLIYQIAANGGLQSRLDAVESIGESRLDALNEMISHDADADLAQTLVRLSQTQTAYEAALKSTATILNTSLLDYLH